MRAGQDLCEHSKIIMGKCFIFGCSHSAGLGMVDFDRYVAVNGHVYDRLTYGYHHSYPAIISKQLGYQDIHNHSILGGGTYAMVRVFRQVIDTVDPVEDLVIACWTGGDRTEYWDEEHGLWIQLSAHKTGFHLLRDSPIALQGLHQPEHIVTSRFQEEHRKWVMESSYQSAQERLERNMRVMNEIAQDHNLRVMNICSFTMGWFPEVDYRGCWPDYSTVQQYWWPTGTRISFLEYSKKKGFKADEWGHFKQDAHESFAGFVLDCISKRSHSPVHG